MPDERGTPGGRSGGAPGALRRGVRRALALAGLLLLATAGRARADDGPKKEWISEDRAAIARLAAALPPAVAAKAWLEALKPWDSREDRDVGGGARRVEAALYGGYTTTWVRALLRGDEVVQVEVRCPVDEGDRALGVESALKDSWGKTPVTTDASGFRYAWSDARSATAHRAELEKALGARGEVVVPESAKAEFALLDGALSPLVFGTACGEDGAPPPGREALEALVKAEATAPLRALLRSPNPEGRVYAAGGLLRLEKGGEALSEADKKAIAAIEASPVRISVCDGCEVSAASAADVLRPPGEGRK